MASPVWLVNVALSDEIEAINAIYGDGTLEIVGAEHNNFKTRLSLPIRGEVAFWIDFPANYPNIPPKLQGADVSLHQTFLRRVQNLTLVLFLNFNALHQPGRVCMFDVLETFLPIVACLTSDGIDLAMASNIIPNFVEEEWRWTFKKHIDMTSYYELTCCVICCDDFFPFTMVPVSCGHYFCFDCFQTGWDVAASDDGAFTCCLTHIPLTTIKEYTTMSKEDEKKYARLTIEKNTENVFWCGHIDCAELIGSFSAWELNRARYRRPGIFCKHCKRYNCAQCRMQKHTGICSTDSILNDLLKQADIRRCPKCGSGIEKNGGCSHMKCINCGSHWWWTAEGTLAPWRAIQPFQLR